MTSVVLDASTAVSWIVASQGTTEGQAVLEDEEIVTFEVPYIFPVELRNALLRLERQGRSDALLTRQGLDMLDGLDIRTSAPAGPVANDALLSLARAEGLSFYDAHYLELAQRRELTLVARDKALLRAARARGVAVRPTLGAPA